LWHNELIHPRPDAQAVNTAQTPAVRKAASAQQATLAAVALQMGWRAR